MTDIYIDLPVIRSLFHKLFELVVPLRVIPVVFYGQSYVSGLSDFTFSNSYGSQPFLHLLDLNSV